MATNFFNNKARAAAFTNGLSKPAPKKETNRQQPWVEKYRPKSLEDVTAQDHTITVLQRTLQSSNLPHMLFYGPPGTGKTSTILALSRTLFGPDMFRSRVLELNASDERGISIVREKVKDFARTQLTHPTEAYKEKYPCPPYKIIILDEADSMTQDAQSALRRTMETYSRITRFCLVCNYVTRIIDPLASRCSKFRFKSLDAKNAVGRLSDIAKLEGVHVEDGVLPALVKAADGDLRKAITFLQSAARLMGARGQGPLEDGDNADEMKIDGEEKGVVNVKVVEEIAGVIPTGVMQRLVDAMQAKGKGKVYREVAKVVEDMVADGWSATQVVSQLYAILLYDDSISDKAKNRIVMVFSEIDKRLVDGADEHLCILDLALRISGVMADQP